MKRNNWRFEALAFAKIVRQEEILKTQYKIEAVNNEPKGIIDEPENKASLVLS